MELSMDCIISGTYYSMGVDSLPAAVYLGDLCGAPKSLKFLQ